MHSYSLSNLICDITASPPKKGGYKDVGGGRRGPKNVRVWRRGLKYRQVGGETPNICERWEESETIREDEGIKSGRWGEKQKNQGGLGPLYTHPPNK